MQNLKILHEWWELLGDVPVTEDDEIDEDFEVNGLVFKKGTDKFEIWHWFEEQNDKFIIGNFI